MSPPCILVIETSSSTCCVGLSLAEGTILERHETAAREHTRLVLPMIDSVLKEAGLSLAQLDALACTVGPGSFTGVRIGVAVTQALSFAAQKPVILIPTLRAIAQEAHQQFQYPEVLAELHASGREFYMALFQVDQGGMMQAVSKEQLLEPEQMVLPAEGNWVRAEALPRAASLLKLAQAEFAKAALVSAAEIQVLYLDKWQQS